MNKSKTVRILCAQAPGIQSSQRFRFEQYLGALRASGFEVHQHPFFDVSVGEILYKRGRVAAKIFGTLLGFFRRLILVFRSKRNEIYFIHREAAPIGPPIIESLLFLLGRRVVYDFDDAIFVPRSMGANSAFSFLKWPSKTAFICRHADKVATCNPFLVNWASQFSSAVFLLPTTVDLNYHVPKPGAPRQRVSVGWTGTWSTAPYLEIVRPALVRLQDELDFEFIVICDTDPGFPELRNYRFIKWRLESEVDDLAQIDIGLMPVPDGTWEKGKVGFKAIQYGGIGIPSVVSSTGSGGEVVLDGKTGRVINNDAASWAEAIGELINNPDLRLRMGAAAREQIDLKYSVRANTPVFLSLFESP